ncbi:MAG: haloacid dehalogenase-like hydrolase [Gemmataceae bacterium]|nr:haloacid dehalogenase-like hydrolase [Gemmataceae bacterium]
MHICLFDIDGTLLASGGAGKAALESSLCEEFSVELRFDVPYSGRTDRAIFRDLLHHHGIAETPTNLKKLLEGYLRRLPGCLQKKKGKVLPGMANLLSLLRERNQVAVGLLTGNIRAGAKTKLGHFGLYEHFAFGGFGDEHFDRDDVAREALAAAREHVHPDLSPDRIWVIGDTPLDVRCARAIGAKVVAVATGMHPVDELQAAGPDLTLRDMSDPEPFLRLWN